MLVAWKDGEPELCYSLKREFAKGMHDKEPQWCVYLSPDDHLGSKRY
jgi:hypothetical protein